MNWLPGGELTAWGGLATAILAFLAYLFNRIKKAGVDQQKTREADAYAKHIQDIERAANARPGGLPDDDPYNRDRS